MRFPNNIYRRFLSVGIIFGLTLLPTSGALIAGGGQPSPMGDSAMTYYPNYEVNENSPGFDEGEMGIKACFASRSQKTAYKLDEPWLLFGGYRVGKEIIKEFGSQINSRIYLVVIHKESGGIFTGRIVKDEPPEKMTTDRPDVGGEVVYFESYFNIDLRKQCRLKPLPGKYWGVALLGNLSTGVLEFEVK